VWFFKPCKVFKKQVGNSLFILKVTVNLIRLNSKQIKMVTPIVLGFKNLSVSTLMLGLLLAFNQLVKYIVLLVQNFLQLTDQYGYEQETISRTSQYYVYNYAKNTRKLESSHELTGAAEQLGEQMSEQKLQFVVLGIFSIIGIVVLYFALDYLIDFTRRFRPWSIILLLVAFVSSVIYIEFIDLRSTGNGYAFMFTTLISIITGMVLIGYSLIFPNYMKQDD
jgi:ABC-type multidrug transport system fused ATPase/permease subunit